VSLKCLVPASQLVLHKYEWMKRKSKNLDRCRESTRCSESFENSFQLVLDCVRVDNDYPLNIFVGDVWLMSLTNWLSDWMNWCRLTGTFCVVKQQLLCDERSLAVRSLVDGRNFARHRFAIFCYRRQRGKMDYMLLHISNQFTMRCTRNLAAVSQVMPL